MGFLIVSFLWLLPSTEILAHGSGASWEQISGQYVVDVGYDPVTFTEGVPVRFDFILKNAESLMPEDFKEVWVRLLHPESFGTVLATGVSYQLLGPTTLLHTFLKPGVYVLEVSFRDGDGVALATSSFEFPVATGGGIPFVGYASFLLLGVCVGFFLTRKYKS